MMQANSMTAATTGPPAAAPPAGYVLTLVALPDPMAAATGYVRDADYRMRLLLKRALRDFGFRCVRCGPHPDPRTTTIPPP